ncbi:MAG: RNA polymerase sporulation sigma factor SigK [Oscillospiraceae bacterium]|nr:RNA polymerase sporulation sigma factor SigK [Oscillospiraceae bacterium]
MLALALLLLSKSLFLSLHLAQNAGSFPKPLSAVEEQECLARAAAGDMDARNKLVEHNLRLVAHIVKKYYTQSDQQDDLISIGTIGLIKAVNTFRPDKNIRLATYAARCIENEILMYFRSQRKLQGEVSLNDTIESDKDGESLYLLDVIGTEDTMLTDLQSRDDTVLIRRLVRQCLTEREADVIRRRYGLEGRESQTQRQVAAVYGISRSYVSRIEKKALQKLESALRELTGTP